jgi:hypothetical protein
MKNLEEYHPGQGCKCGAYAQFECSCDVDWTDPQVYALRARIRIAERILGCDLEKHPDFEKCQPDNTILGIWKYDSFPYFLCGHVHKFFEDDRAEIKGYGPGYKFTLIKVLYGEEGSKFKERFDTLREDHARYQTNFNQNWYNIADELLHGSTDNND